MKTDIFAHWLLFGSSALALFVQPTEAMAATAGFGFQVRPAFSGVATKASPAPFGLVRGAGVAPLEYTDDSRFPRSRFISPMAVQRPIAAGDLKHALTIRSVSFERYKDSAIVRRGGLRLYTIDPNHMVYEVVTSFSHDYAVRGNHWSYGRRTFILDAETGRVLIDGTEGHMTVNAGVERARLAAQRRPGVMFSAAQLARKRRALPTR